MEQGVNKEDSEFIFEPIPKGITVHGFSLLIVLFVSILTISYYFRIPQVVVLKVSISNGDVLTICSPTQLEQIRTSEKISIILPPLEEKVNGFLRFEKRVINKDNILIPVSVDSMDLREIPAKSEVICSGEIVVGESNLFSKILNKPNSKPQ